MKKIILVLTLLISNLSLTAQNRFDKCTVSYNDGQKIVEVKGDNGVTVIIAKKDDNMVTKHQNLFLMIINESPNNFNFDPSKISVETVNKGKKVYSSIYTCEEWIKKEKTRIFLWGPNNTESQTVNTKVQNSDGSTTTIETKVDVVTNANDKARADAEGVINSTYFKRVTIYSGQSQQGIIVAKNPKAQNIIVSVPVNGNIYVIDFSNE